MVVKDNQPRLLADLKTLFTRPPGPAQDLRTVQQVTKAHGRIEIRTLSASADLKGYLDWPGGEQGLRLERRVYYLASGKQFCEVDYAVLSLSPDQIDLETVLTRWREHWHIENKLHWVRDVVMGEDASRVRRDDAPHALAALRNAVITLVKLFGFDSLTQARRHYALNFHEAVSIVC
jgi:hypothetical protein